MTLIDKRVVVILIITISLLFLYFIIFIRNHKQIEGFEDKYHLSVDEYDKQYVDMCDIVWVDKDMVEGIVKKIDNKTLKNWDKDDVNILDCGCGIGYYNNFFGLLGYKSIQYV